MSDDPSTPPRVRWARLRHAIIGQLLASPPEPGELSSELESLAERPWRHPTHGEVVRFSAKTIERWYYVARNDPNPIVALERKVPKHAGTHPSITPTMDEAIRKLRREHRRWSHQLLFDNLCAEARQHPEIGVPPGYATVCRFLRHHGLLKQPKPKRHENDPEFVPREKRSFEVSHVMALWHMDFHKGKRKVLVASGEWQVVVLLGVLDDRSRLCCHLQWYPIEQENTQSFIHGLTQALQKRGMPRALLTDNGAPMTAAETVEGLDRLTIQHHTTLAQTPEQNGKQECFWAQVEGRLMAMLENERELTLAKLNLATQAWVEQEYNRETHREIGEAPLQRFLAGPSVGRPCLGTEELRRAFRMQVTRQQRLSDGTISVCGVRFELPSVYRTLLRPTVRVSRWDLSAIALVDPRKGTHLATLYPLDKEANADGRRRPLTPATNAAAPEAPVASTGIAPLLRQYMADYVATGMPPAYVPYNPSKPEEEG